MSAAAVHDWLDHPFAPALLRFNLHVADLLHPQRHIEWEPLPVQRADPRAVAGLGRHASAFILRRLGLRPVRSLDDPTLPLCMAGPDLFERLTRCCGLLVLGPAVRRVIVRAEVQALRAQLGEEGLHFCRVQVPSTWAGGGDSPALRAESRVQALGLGGALLERAFACASPPVAQRARLRLAPDLDAWRGELPESLGNPAAALAAARGVLQILDPTWLSSFPAPP